MDLLNFIRDLKSLNLKTPILIKNDSDYLPKLKEIYHTIGKMAEKHNVEYLSEIINGVQNAIEEYYKGNTEKSLGLIDNIVKEICESQYICTNFNFSGAFNNLIQEKVLDEVDLFRGRVETSKDDLGKFDMYHIPYEKRQKISNQRFSIAGIPCLYLGKSIYTCWKELNRPMDSEFYVSHVRVKDEIKILNLAINYEKLLSIANVKKFPQNIDQQDFVLSYVKTWILNIACSFYVKDADRNFKSEYIVPQLLMLSLKKRNISAVAYLSRRISEECLSMDFAPLNINVAIIMDESDGKYVENNYSYSIKMKKISISNPVNFSEFKNLCRIRTSQNGKSDNCESSQIYVNKVFEYTNRNIEYNNTYFAKFENYLLGFLHEDEQK